MQLLSKVASNLVLCVRASPRE